MTNRVMQAKYKKLAAGRRKAYLKRPKSSGPAVGWLDWIHGRARELTAFEKWFFDETQFTDATQASSDAKRDALIAAGKGVDVYDDDGAIARVDKMPQSSPKTAKEDVAERERKRKKLEKELGISAYNYVSLDENLELNVKRCLVWSLPDRFYIIRKSKFGDKETVWRSIQYPSRSKAMTQFFRNKITWKEIVKMHET